MSSSPVAASLTNSGTIEDDKTGTFWHGNNLGTSVDDGSFRPVRIAALGFDERFAAFVDEIRAATSQAGFGLVTNPDRLYSIHDLAALA